MTRVLVVGAVLCLSLATSTPSYAQPTNEARALFAEGRSSMRDGRFADARDAFLRSLELNPRPSVAFNLAVAHTRTGEYVAAVVLFERLLSGGFGDLPRARRQEADALKDEAESSVATLTVHLPPVEGLNVRVDGQVYSAERMRLDPGEHIVSINSARHVPVEVRVALGRGGEETIRPELELREDERLGRLRVTTPVEGGVLSLDGVADGHELDERLPPGEYRVVLREAGRQSERLIQVEAGVEARYELDFERAEGRRAWPWVVAGVLLAGAGAGVAAYFLTRPQPREDMAFGQFTTLRAP